MTFNNSHINTPMTRMGDEFIFKFEVEDDTRFDYGFTITRTAAGKRVDIWEGANSAGEYFTKNLSTANADETVVDRKFYFGDFRSDEWTDLRTKAVIASGPGANVQPPRIHFQVQYRNPAASEVRLVWGLDNFTRVPPTLPSETFPT